MSKNKVAMQTMSKHVYILVFCFLQGLYLRAAHADVELHDVLTSVYEHFPMVLAAQKKVESQEQKVIASQGAFDLTLHSEADIRAQGYYDGRSIDVYAQKPLMFNAGKVYGGYRISDGLYPSYEGKRHTLDQGEINAGLQFSVWRNRSIDEPRGMLWNSQIQQSIEEMKLRQVELDVHKKAVQQYWHWVVQGSIYRVYENLVQIALARDKALQERVRKGDLAEIYLSENRQYLANRQLQVAHAKQDFEKASYGLSLFYRDSSGQPQIPTIESIPGFTIDSETLVLLDVENDIAYAMDRAPSLKILDLQAEQLGYMIRLGKNELSPLLDFDFSVSKISVKVSPS
ncbi:MAG: TolC family protein [Bdellovibrionota bacterium]